MDKYKQVVLKCIIYVVLALILCTISARSIQRMMLPRAEAIYPQSGALRYVYQYVGTFITDDKGTHLVWDCSDEELSEMQAQARLSITCEWAEPDGTMRFDTEFAPLTKSPNAQQGMSDYQGTLSVADATVAHIKINAESGKYNLVLPISCIVFKNGNSYVATLNPKGSMWGPRDTVKLTEVTLDTYNSTHAAASSSVLPDTKLLAYPSRELEDGEEVKVIA